MPKEPAKPVTVILGPAALIQAQVLVGAEGEQVAADCRLPLSSLSEKERAYVTKLIVRESQKG